MPVGEHYPILPIPWIPQQTEMVPAGVLTIGVGYRVLDEAIAKAYLDEVGYRRDDGMGGERTYQFRDAGVCLHVLGPARDGESDELVEYLRLDCFDDEPHYHYVYNEEGAQDRVFLDPTVDGDPMEWALERVRTRMPDVLRKVGAPRLAQQIDPDAMNGAIPAVRAAVDRAFARAAQLTP
jgi:hypothetical protein